MMVIKYITFILGIFVVLAASTYKVRQMLPTNDGMLKNYRIDKTVTLRTKIIKGCEVGDLDSMFQVTSNLNSQDLLVSLETFDPNDQGPIASRKINFRQLKNRPLSIDLELHDVFNKGELGLYICTASSDRDSCRKKKPVNMAKIADAAALNPYRPIPLKEIADKEDRVLFFQFLSVERGTLTLLSDQLTLENRIKRLKQNIEPSWLAKRVGEAISMTSSLPVSMSEGNKNFYMDLNLPVYDEQYCKNIVANEHQQKVNKYMRLRNKKTKRTK